MKLKVGEQISTIPQGVYDLIIRKIELSTTYKRPCLVFEFEVARGEHKGLSLKAFCNADYKHFSNRTKLYRWNTAITGDELEQGDHIDTNDFIGKIVRAEVVTKISKKTKMEFSNVVDIYNVVDEA